jgi:hypothetical protein
MACNGSCACNLPVSQQREEGTRVEMASDDPAARLPQQNLNKNASGSAVRGNFCQTERLK